MNVILKRAAVVTGLAAGLLVSAALAGDGISQRNTALDHLLPVFEPPQVDLSGYKPAQSRPGQDAGLAVAAAISGGGHRAANFAVGVLLGLEDLELEGRRFNLLKEIDYFSSVSGGGFAAGAYLASLWDWLGATNRLPGEFSFRAALEHENGRLLASLERDYQSSIFQAWVHPACLDYRDSGDLMELKFDRHLLGAAHREGGRSLLMGDIFRRVADPRPVMLPYWVANATVYENGVRFPFTPNVLEAYRVETCTHQMERLDLCGDPGRLPMAVAVRASASFPVAIPASTFQCRPGLDELNPFLHLVDGGLTDNLGIRTACDLLRQDPAPRKVLIVIDAYKGIDQPYSSTESSPVGPPVALRVMNIALDSDHAHLPLLFEALRRDPDLQGLEVLNLTFAELKPEALARVQDTDAELRRLRRAHAEAVMRRVRRELNSALRLQEEAAEQAQQEFALYDDARAVATSLSITKSEQALLLQAGRAVVERNRARVAQACGVGVGNPSVSGEQ